MINYYFLITFNKLRIYILRKPKGGSIYKSVAINLCYPVPNTHVPTFFFFFIFFFIFIFIYFLIKMYGPLTSVRLSTTSNPE